MSKWPLNLKFFPSIEEQLICDKTEEAAKFKVNPDIQFRDVVK